MKIGILTFHFVENYGAALQAFALQRHLRNSGYDETEIVDYRPKYLRERYDFFDRYFLDTIKERNFVLGAKLFSYIVLTFPDKVRKKYGFYRFQKECMKLSSKRYFDYETLKADIEQFDYLVCGSDQVWNGDITGGLDPAFFGFFDDTSVKSMGYAASIGSTVIQKKYLEKFKKYIEPLYPASVREADAQNALQKLGIESQVVCDPTLLLTREEWKEAVKLKKYTKKYILVYTLEHNDLIDEAAAQIAKELGLEIWEICLNRRLDAKNHKLICGASPCDFLSLINGAEIVITNSFHGTVFSIIFHKNMRVAHHLTRGSRTRNLLEKYKLTQCDLSEIKDIERENAVDWETTDAVISEDRQKSMEIFECFRRTVYECD